MLNRRGGEFFDPSAPPPAPVALPELSFLKKGPPHEESPRRETAAKFAEHRIVAAGRTAWESIARAERETFESWKAVARSLGGSRQASCASRLRGRCTERGALHCRADGLAHQELWQSANAKATRYWCCRMHEHLPDIEQWRATLPESRREKLINPLSVCRAWLRATQVNGKCHGDPLKAAEAAWRRFCSCLERIAGG